MRNKLPKLKPKQQLTKTKTMEAKDQILGVCRNLNDGLISFNQAKMEILRILTDSVNVKTFNCKVVSISAFTPTNKNHITVEILGEENYIANYLNIGHEIEITHYRK